MLKYILSLLVAFTFTAQAQLRYQEGKDYEVLKTVIEEQQNPKVIEFFWIGCPHCYSVEPGVQKWLKEKPENITFERVPAIPSERWAVAAMLYYIAEHLKIENGLEKLFHAVHEQNKNAIIFRIEDGQTFFQQEFGVSAEDFEKAMKSFAVQQKLKRAKQLFDASGLSSVPSFVVNGRYVVPVKGNHDEYFSKITELSKILK